MSNGVELFLDSGAFSAMTQGAIIDLKEYIRFVKDNLDVLAVYANLDVIGDPDKTWANQLAMEKAGLHPLPCYHVGEDIEYLKNYMARYDYIALGGMVGKKGLAGYLDVLFSKHLCGADGMPLVKVHGFGMTSLSLMLRYPWYSVDSTSWVIAGRLGDVYIPKPWKGVLEDPWKVAVSFRSPSRNVSGEHILNLPPTQKRMVLSYIESKGQVLGKSEFRKAKAGHVLAGNERPHGKVKGGALAVDGEIEVIVEEGICNDYRKRDELNIAYFLDLEKAMPEWPWPFVMSRKTGGFAL